VAKTRPTIPVAQSIDVARQRMRVRQQQMPEGHRLRMLADA